MIAKGKRISFIASHSTHSLQSLYHLFTAVLIAHTIGSELIERITNHCGVKLQQILGQGASLITKNILHLTELFIERCYPREGFAHPPRAEHELIEVNEVTLCSFGYFHGDDERDWDAGAELYEEHEEVHNKGRAACVSVLPIEITVAVYNRSLRFY